jgi:hypothetical protein
MENKMFNELLKFEKERTKKQAFGFYLAYLALGFLILFALGMNSANFIQKRMRWYLCLYGISLNSKIQILSKGCIISE